MFHEKPLQANVSHLGSLEGDSTPKWKEADKLDFGQWPHVTRFRNWKTALRREVITGSAHSR